MSGGRWTFLYCLLGILSVAVPLGVNGQGWEVLPGIVLESSFTGEILSNLSGGRHRGTVSLGELDATATVNLDALCDQRGGTLFLYGLGTHGGSPSKLVGDAQGVSNIEAPDAVRLYEAWYEQLLLDARLSVLAGLYSLDSEFNVVRAAALFLNSSHGTGAPLALSGRNGPSIFPYRRACG